MSDWHGYPWDRPGLDESQRRMWETVDEFSTAAAYREQQRAKEQQELFAKLDEFWQRDLESRA